MKYTYSILFADKSTKIVDSLYDAAIMAGCDAPWDRSHRHMITKLFAGYSNYTSLKDKTHFTIQWGDNYITRALRNAPIPEAKAEIVNTGADKDDTFRPCPMPLQTGNGYSFILTNHAIERIYDRFDSSTNKFLKEISGIPYKNFTQIETGNRNVFKVKISDGLEAIVQNVSPSEFVVITLKPSVKA